MKSCFDGYLTPECATCYYWMAGTPNDNGEWAIGCGFHYPIDMCPAFKKMMDQTEQIEQTE